MTSTQPPLVGRVSRSPGPSRRGPLRTVWTAVSGVTGALVGIAPHVLHHIGPLVGTALVAGAGGTALFGAVGVLASVPMLIKLRRRFRSWWAPGIALLVFAAAFVVSTTVIGPLIRGDDSRAPSSPSQTQLPAGHDQHHR